MPNLTIRSFSLVLICALSGCATTNKQNSPVACNETTNLCTLSNDKYSVAIDVVRGGRIKNFSYEGFEFLSQLEVTPFSWGSTFWVSPQKSWGWPPIKVHDTDPYRILKQDGSLTVASKSAHGIRLEKSFTLTDKALDIQYCMQANKAVKDIAAWEITRVPLTGVINAWIDPNATRVTFGKWDKPLAGTQQFTLDLGSNQATPAQAKLNLDSVRAYVDLDIAGYTFRKSFPDIDAHDTVIGESDLQLFVDEVGYAEIEAQSQRVNLNKGEEFCWTTHWSALKNVK